MQTHYLPSLIDRLEDDGAVASVAGGGISMTDFKSIVIRDIVHILNQPRFFFPLNVTGPAGAAQEVRSAAHYPLVAESVLNFGLDIPFGTAVSPQVLEQIRFGVQRSIELFEPRARNVKVGLWNETEISADQFLTPTEQRNMTGRPIFAIEAEIVAEPFVEHIRIKTELDVISGECLML